MHQTPGHPLSLKAHDVAHASAAASACTPSSGLLDAEQIETKAMDNVRNQLVANLGEGEGLRGTCTIA